MRSLFKRIGLIAVAIELALLANAQGAIAAIGSSCRLDQKINLVVITAKFTPEPNFPLQPGTNYVFSIGYVAGNNGNFYTYSKGQLKLDQLMQNVSTTFTMDKINKLAVIGQYQLAFTESANPNMRRSANFVCGL